MIDSIPCSTSKTIGTKPSPPPTITKTEFKDNNNNRKRRTAENELN